MRPESTAGPAAGAPGPGERRIDDEIAALFEEYRTSREEITQLIRRLRLPIRYDAVLADAYRPRAAITHRINVRRYARQKQAALAAHRSQVHGRGRLAPLLRLPAPAFGLILGYEWFTDACDASGSCGPPAGSCPRILRRCSAERAAPRGMGVLPKRLDNPSNGRHLPVPALLLRPGGRAPAAGDFRGRGTSPRWAGSSR